MIRSSRRNRRLTLAGSAVVALAAAVAGTPAVASSPWQVVAEGLDNPRQLSFSSSGSLYVAEAGVGGAGPCMMGPEGEEVCYGKSGAVTKIRHGHQRRVITRLPSLAPEGGGGAIGPGDVRVTGRHRYAVTIGLGADPAVREDLPWLGRRLMGTIIAGKFWHRPKVVADLAAHEAATDPDGAGPDSNPTGLIGRWGRYVATDSGGNSLVYARHGKVRTIAVFDSPGTAPAPFPPFDEIPMQPVPTSVAVGPDHAFYVSELTGFPFAPGAARIHRVVPGQAPTVYATGLTNVTDLAWYRGDLYAVQLADSGLAGVPPGELPMGSLLRVDPGGAHETVAGPLPAPYGVAFRHHKAYVTTCSVCADAGSVIKVPVS